MALIGGKLFYGWITDRIGGFRSNLLFTGIFFAGLVLACLAPLHSLILGVTAMIILGIGYPISTIGPSVWAADLAEPEAVAKVVRRLQILYAAGALIFSSVPGILADRYGSYVCAYVIFAAMLIVMFAMLLIAYRLRSEPA